MLFNSVVFLWFFLIVYSLYLLTMRRLRLQNALLLVAGYVFYGWWSVKFLSLLVWTTVFDYVIARLLGRTEDQRRRKILLVFSLTSSLTILGVFKYFNFFADSLAAVLTALGLHPGSHVLNVVLPMGISFYTFQTMAYVIEVYKRKTEPCRNLLDFAVYSAFFPQLVAGPIERPWSLLPQVQRPRQITPAMVNAGLWLVLWGYFKKLVIADGLARLSEVTFATGLPVHGVDVILGILAFTVQIYADFSGYTDIARGLAHLLGFELLLNFRLPYFAKDPSDFWQRWHISLSQWYRDYLYIPLGGSRHGEWKTCRNLLVTMLLCGLWHGAAWHFVAWGGYHGLLSAAYRLAGRLRPAGSERTGPLLNLGRTLLMFAFAALGWTLFRANTVSDAWHLLRQASFATTVSTSSFVKYLALCVSPLVVLDTWQHRAGDLLAPSKAPVVLRGLLYGALLVGLICIGARTGVDFIYFQF
jgi:D-alanyl-lipoteichoic acid acyltransferase DltB (MBOAT superfamily)